MSEYKCDFCVSSEIIWKYPVSDFGANTNSIYSCNTCSNLIEQDNWHEIDARAAQSIKNDTAGERRFYEDNNDLQAAVFTFHKKFREHRTGPRQRFERMPPFASQPTSDAPNVLRHTVNETGEVAYLDEGFTPEQLSDPNTIEQILGAVGSDQALRGVDPITMPVKWPPVWEGSRTYKDAVAGVYGENPRLDDEFDASPSMIIARWIFPEIAKAHPLVIEPDQMDAIDHEDWSFCESVDYALMAHLPFEPLYLDFGGIHDACIEVDCELGPANLRGAVIWRDTRWKIPTLAVAPIGGFEYTTENIAGFLQSEHNIHSEVFREFTAAWQGDASPIQTRQWKHQPSGIIWYGLQELTEESMGNITQDDDKYHLTEDIGLIYTHDLGYRDRVAKVPMHYALSNVIGALIPERRLQEEHVPICSASNIRPVPREMLEEKDQREAYIDTIFLDTELTARLAQRSLLGLYFLENAPTTIEPAPLSRQVRKQVKRDDNKEISSIVVIRSKRYQRNQDNGDVEHYAREYSHRWERRGYFMHIHENNRHYQNRPDLIKPCHKCAREHAENQRAMKDSTIEELPYPHTESADCIKKWIEPTVCGPAGKPLKKKVRIKHG